jgi:hypothetical protein
MYRTATIECRDADFLSWTPLGAAALQDQLERTVLTLPPPATGQPAAYADGEAYADSPELETAFPFSSAIASWSADTPEGSALEILLRARSGGLWSSWFSMGLWASGDRAYARHSVAGQSDALGKVDTDTLNLYAPADALQARVRLLSADARALPSLSRLVLAYSEPKPAPARSGGGSAAAGDAATGDAAAAAQPEGATPPAWVGELAGVPRCSQMVYPDGGKVWCSPTCVAMILSYWRGRAGTCEAAIRDAVRGVYDGVFDGYGNWSFNAAYAAAQGYEACVARFPSLSALTPWLKAGVPIALSVSWNNDEGRALSGAPLAKSSGHLTLLVGFDAAGDPIMHEPAAPSDGEVRRTYRRAELEGRWLSASGGACYLIYPRGHAVPAFGRP